MTISKDFSNSTLAFEFAADAPLIFSLKDCSDSIRDHLALHGAIQMAEAKANQSDDCESAFEGAEDTIAYIYEQYPEKKSIPIPLGLIIKTISRIKGYSAQEAIEKWSQLPQEKRIEVVTKSRVKNMIVVIRGERASSRLKQLDNETDGTRSKLYNHDSDFENRKARIRFINGSHLEIDLALVKDVNAIALYGAEQKISDSYSGIKNGKEKRSAAERIVHNLYAGTWTSKKGAAGQDIDRSALDTQVTKQLAELMRWPVHATMIAVSHINEQDKLRLISGEAKVLLSKFSQKRGMGNNPSQCNQRAIADLLDDVIDRLMPLDDYSMPTGRNYEEEK